MTPYYQDEAVTLYHADCRDVLPTLEKVDHVITDPPYTQRTSVNSRSGKLDGRTFVDAHKRVIGFDGVDGLEAGITSDCLGVARRWVVVFCALEQLGRYESASGECWIRAAVWHRTNSAPQFTGDRPGQACEGVAIMHPKGRKRWNRGGASLFYEGPTVNAVSDRDRGTEHPTTKPWWLMAAVLNDFTDPCDLILDPFAGSGTTGVAAKRLGRKAILIEREEKYCAVAARRLSQGALNLEFTA